MQNKKMRLYTSESGGDCGQNWVKSDYETDLTQPMSLSKCLNTAKDYIGSCLITFVFILMISPLPLVIALSSVLVSFYTYTYTHIHTNYDAE